MTRRHPAHPEQTAEAVFGIFDGVTSAWGVIAGALAVGVPTARIAAVAAGLAVAATVSMAGGEYLSSASGTGELAQAGVMGVATFVGSFAPALPFLVLSRWPATAASAAITAVLVVAIIDARYHRGESLLRASTITLAILAVATGLSVAVSVAFGAAG